MSKRQQYAPTHPTAQKLNLLLSKLLVLQSLPFKVVDSAPFRELMACAESSWRVPSHHFFAKKAVPALHNFVEQKVGQSLSLSMGTKVHGSDMSFMAHLVNVVPDQPQQQLGQVTLN
ncbi:zinc finger BED domain-containing protein 4-like [Hyla sarda]|uniref:zinc finger BED domain-containing protein 4-like n=1 Tax=Hyla sarda TaxID=327740 RepID=UPI0024C22D80|nr:zinc finger BED domain-containing protein 4-like [Hyla sarda]